MWVAMEGVWRIGRSPKSRWMGDRGDSAVGEVQITRAWGALPIFSMLQAWGMPLLFGQAPHEGWP